MMLYLYNIRLGNLIRPVPGFLRARVADLAEQRLRAAAGLGLPSDVVDEGVFLGAGTVGAGCVKP